MTVNDGLDKRIEESPCNFSDVFCDRNRSIRNYPVSPYAGRKEDVMRQGRDDLEQSDRDSRKAVISVSSKEIQKDSNIKDQRKTGNSCINVVNDLLRNNRICFISFLECLNPLNFLDTQQDGDKNDKLQVCKSIESKVPLTIFLESKQQFFSRSGEAEEKVVFLKSTLDLRNRTATVDTEGSTLQNEKSQYELDSTTISDHDYDQDISITRTISSISFSSFSELSICSLDLPSNDPLCILGLEMDDREASNDDSRIIKCQTDEMDRESYMSYNVGKDDSCKITCGGQNMFTWGDVYTDIDILDTKGDSLMSYEDLISEGLSYDENDAGLSNIQTFSLNYHSKEERVDLDQLCQESLQSCSMKSHAIDEDNK